MSKMLEAVKIYRDSPNTFGHESADEKRFVLKKLMGATASQRFLQEALVDAMSFGDYEEGSMGIRHLWQRLKDNEDVLREAEKKYDAVIASLPYKTLPGQVHCVPSIAIQIAKMEANKKA